MDLNNNFREFVIMAKYGKTSYKLRDCPLPCLITGGNLLISTHSVLTKARSLSKKRDLGPRSRYGR